MLPSGSGDGGGDLGLLGLASSSSSSSSRSSISFEEVGNGSFFKPTASASSSGNKPWRSGNASSQHFADDSRSSLGSGASFFSAEEESTYTGGSASAQLAASPESAAASTQVPPAAAAASEVDSASSSHPATPSRRSSFAWARAKAGALITSASSSGTGDLASRSPNVSGNAALPGMGMEGREEDEAFAITPTPAQHSTPAAPQTPDVPGRTASLPDRTPRPSISTTREPGSAATIVPSKASSMPSAGLGIALHAPTPAPAPVVAAPVARLAIPTADAEPMLRRETLQRWVLSVGCVNFDLDKGPDLEFLYPPLGISREERDSIAFSSFPDTSIFDDGFSVFSWRVREVPIPSSSSSTHALAPPERVDSPSSISSSGSRGRVSPQGLAATLGRGGPSPTGTAGRASGLGQRLLSTQLFSGSSSSNVSRESSPSLPSTSRHVDRTASTSSASGASLSSRSSSPMPSFGSPVASEAELPGDARKAGYMPLNAAQGGAETPTNSAFAEAEEERRLQRDVAISREGSSIGQLLSGSSTSTNYIHGYVFFRQKRDASIRRGYFQKSVVILSHLPYVSLFSKVVAQLGPLFFEHGTPMLEAFCQDVANWPSPEAGATLSLPILGSVLTVALPWGSQMQSPAPTETNTHVPKSLGRANTLRSRMKRTPSRGDAEAEEEDNSKAILASIPSSLLVDTFRDTLPDMWLLWECMLLAEPILVVGPDPKACSEAVWHMLDMIRPIPFGGDWRPFFTIHDYDFKTLVTRNKPQSGTVLGITNPFMLQAASHWPHVLRVGRAARKAQKHNAQKAAGPPGSGGGVAGGNRAGGGGPEHVPSFTSKMKRRISKDRPLLRKLVEKQESDEASNAMLRRHFSDLTERFLAPLNRYVASLIPAGFDLSSPTAAPQIKPFNTDAFLASLKAHGTPLPIRSRSLPTGAAVRQSLYMDFLKCPNFSLWLQARMVAAEEEQWRRRVAVLEQGDVLSFAKDHGEVEALDLWSRLVEEIRSLDARLATPPEPGPGSRWRTDNPCSSNSASPITPADSNAAAASATPARMRHAHNASTSSLGSTHSLNRTDEANLLARRARLTAQLDRLSQTLSEELRTSLRLAK